MAVTSIVCPKCSGALPQDMWGGAALRQCPTCGTQIVVQVFPALFQMIPQGQSAEPILVDGEAGCFYHPHKRAVIPCGDCGRFLCAVCDVELNGRHLCPGCLDTGRKKRTLVELENRRTLHDSAALGLSLVPGLLCWPVTVLTAPAAIYLAVLSFFRPGSIVPRTRVRAYLAILFSILQIAGWGLALAGAFKNL